MGKGRTLRYKEEIVNGNKVVNNCDKSNRKSQFVYFNYKNFISIISYFKFISQSIIKGLLCNNASIQITVLQAIHQGAILQNLLN